MPASGSHTKQRRRTPRGFTLIELMIVVAILAVLASIAVPKFAELIRKSNEGATRGKLGSIRGAISIYYADTEGQFPGDLAYVTQSGSKYVNGSVSIYTTDHGISNNIDNLAAFDPAADNGNLGYVNAGANIGMVWVECTHTDTKGSIWTTY